MYIEASPAAGTNCTVMPRTTPTSSADSTTPQKLPSPPITTTTKAAVRISAPMAGCTLTIGASSSYLVPLLLQWGQPYGAATANLELLVFRNGALYATATNASVGQPTNPWTGVMLPGGATYQIAIENLSGANPALIRATTAA